MAAPSTHDVITRLVDRDSRITIELPFEAHIEWADARGREVHDALLESRDDGHLVGEPGEGDGSIAWWSTTRLTVEGLRVLGDWPPLGREWDQGPWDDGYWGQRARPLLKRLHDEPPYAGCYLKPIGTPGEEWLDWTAALLLVEGG